MIKQIQENSRIPVISRPSDAKDALNGAAMTYFNDTLRASDIYNKIVETKFNAAPLSDLLRKAEKEDGICIC